MLSVDVLAVLPLDEPPVLSVPAPSPVDVLSVGLAESPCPSVVEPVDASVPVPGSPVDPVVALAPDPSDPHAASINPSKHACLIISSPSSIYPRSLAGRCNDQATTRQEPR
ncbi:hypothetical protein [Nannocystis punicea]|uniref:Uncharacterized protein n=1 Tax=Nannocystis punicea TaxID=2995304 RepID=A0ABY7H4P5_9BACT|nr:hypothetical protein [Nannocystis poenicansa]WAS94241.1 hypothetical protein O0S08_49600 [Nannocystis poenicansa]